MQKCRRLVSLLALSLPLVAWAEVPVVDNNSGSYPAPSYETSGAYAGGGAQAPTSAQGMLFNQLQQMQDEIGRLRGMLEEQQNDIQRMKQENLERYKDLDQRLSSGAAGAAATQNSSAGGDSSAGAAPAPASAGASEPDPEKEKLFYDAAFDLIKTKDFDKANQAFSAFLRKYPKSQYAGNAQYWLGEVNLAQGNLQGAAQAFADVGQKYPQHSKVPDSMFKLGDVEQRLGDQDKAKRTFQQVIAQFPNSSAAQLAQRNLQRM
ncbi:MULTISPECIES: tol-pal system protein YbgF [Pseudomonas]|uniref:tol-pal system protein YbgF n=1 Tax=Pseudomonas TaxID=286 RepID=UPI0002556A75|nr:MULTISPECIES: tol-pal system protein YbgF [Pseudomonas]